MPTPERFRVNHFKLKFIAAALIVAAFLLAAAASRHMQESAISRAPLDPPPYWAYAVNPPVSPSEASAQPDESVQLHVPGSNISFTI